MSHLTMTTGQRILAALEAEATATRKCVERIPADKFDFKPHEKSMALGYLALVVAEIPLWIAHMAEKPDLDFATFPHFAAKDGADLAKHFDENMDKARAALKDITDKQLDEQFNLLFNGQVVFTSTKYENIDSSVRHLVHHRGQLTVYMRLNDIPVPSLYGPSADDQGA